MAYSSLARGEIHIWYLPCEDPPGAACVQRHASILSSEELERSSRFVFDKDRHLFLATQALLRISLSSYVDVAPERWGFARGPRGKPYLVFPPGIPPLQFNASHTTGMAAVVVAVEDEVGIDVEDTRRQVGFEAARHCFSECEIAHLAQLDGARQNDLFLQYWTLKEAYVKARGLGLSLPLRDFSFRLAADRPPEIRFSSGLQDDPKNWQFHQHRPTAHHCLAVALHRPVATPSTFVVREMGPLLPPQSSSPLG